MHHCIEGDFSPLRRCNIFLYLRLTVDWSICKASAALVVVRYRSIANEINCSSNNCCASLNGMTSVIIGSTCFVDVKLINEYRKSAVMTSSSAKTTKRSIKSCNSLILPGQEEASNRRIASCDR